MSKNKKEISKMRELSQVEEDSIMDKIGTMKVILLMEWEKDKERWYGQMVVFTLVDFLKEKQMVLELLDYLLEYSTKVSSEMIKWF